MKPLLGPAAGLAALIVLSIAGASTAVKIASHPSPPEALICTRTLAAGGDIQAFVDSLSAGDVGCLHGGTYSPSSTVNLDRSGVTLQSYPGETAVVTREVQLGCGSCSGSTLMNFTIQGAPKAGEDGVTVDGTGMTVDHMVIRHTGSMGIQVHSDSDNTVITRTWVDDAGLGVLDANGGPHGIYFSHGSGQVTDNLVTNSTGYGIQVYPNGSLHDVTVEENTVVGSRYKGGIILDGTPGPNIKIVNNIVSGNHTNGEIWRTCPPSAGCVGDHILCWQNAGGCTSGAYSSSMTNMVTADPQFIDGQYHVAASSPAVDTANWSFMAPNDRDGVTRQQGPAPDLGAYERW